MAGGVTRPPHWIFDARRFELLYAPDRVQPIYGTSDPRAAEQYLFPQAREILSQWWQDGREVLTGAELRKALDEWLPHTKQGALKAFQDHATRMERHGFIRRLGRE